MRDNSTTLPAMNRAQLTQLLRILAPYRAEPITPAVIGLALRLARVTALEAPR